MTKNYEIVFTIYEKEKDGTRKQVAQPDKNFFQNLSGEFEVCGKYTKIFISKPGKDTHLCVGEIKNGVFCLSTDYHD